jgi:hypothetical protein
VSTIRERDAAWDGHNRMAPMADRHALLIAGDALVEAATVFQNHHRRTECGYYVDLGHWTDACQRAEEAFGIALAAWKAATG